MAATARELMDGYRTAFSHRGAVAESLFLVSGMTDVGSMTEAVAAGVPKIGDPCRRPGMGAAVCRNVQLVRVISPTAALFRAEYHSIGPWPFFIRLSSASAAVNERFSTVIAHTAVATWLERPLPLYGETVWTHKSFPRSRGVHEIVEVRDRYTPPATFHSVVARNLLRAYTVQGVPCVLRGATYRLDQSNQCRIVTMFVTTSPLPAIEPVSGVIDISIPALGPMDEYDYKPPAYPYPPECVVVPAATLYPAGEALPWLT